MRDHDPQRELTVQSRAQTGSEVSGWSYGWTQRPENKGIVSWHLKGRTACRRDHKDGLRDEGRARAEAAIGDTVSIAVAATAILQTGAILFGHFSCMAGRMLSMVVHCLHRLVLHIAGRLFERDDATQRQHHQKGDDDPVNTIARVLAHIRMIVLGDSAGKLHAAKILPHAAFKGINRE